MVTYVFVTQPDGFQDPTCPHYVCKLKKALYGLKQAHRAWFHKLKTALLNLRCFSFCSTSTFIQ